MGELSEKFKVAVKRTAPKFVKLVAPFMLLGTGHASAANTDNQGNESFYQRIELQGDNFTSASEAGVNSRGDSFEYTEIVTNLPGGYQIEESNRKEWSKEADDPTVTGGKILHCPDGTQINLSDALKGADDIVPVGGTNVEARRRQIKNSKLIASALNNCPEMNDEAKDAVHYYLENLTKNHDEPSAVKLSSNTYQVTNCNSGR